LASIWTFNTKKTNNLAFVIILQISLDLLDFVPFRTGQKTCLSSVLMLFQNRPEPFGGFTVIPIFGNTVAPP